MALDFPASPTNGQVYGSYVYNSTVGAWQAREDSATVATISTVLPTNANPGDIWYDSDDGTSYIYYDDGTSAQWVELLSSGLPLLNTKADLTGATFTGNISAPQFISNQTTGTPPLSVSSTTVVTNLNADLLDGQHASVYSPAGMVSQFAGATAPIGWLLCDGTAVSRATYANLFAAIGTSYGTGDGSTTFNLPNLKGRVPVGLDPADTSFDVVGETGGAKTHTLTEAQLPGHTHTFSGTTSDNGSHKHGVWWEGGSDSDEDYPAGGFNAFRTTDRRWALKSDGYPMESAGSHTHTYSGTTSIGSGSGQAHNILQPYIVLNYMIKV